MLEDEWKFHLYSATRWKDYVRHFLLSVINGSDRASVLSADGEPKGIVVLRDMDGPKLDFSKSLDRIDSEVRTDQSFGQYAKDIAALHGVYEMFSSRYKSPEWAELALLIVSGDCKGMGLGRRMIGEAERIVTANGMKGLFFYTDTDCNFGFYDHIGAKRIAYSDIECMGEPLRVFVYALTF